MRSASRPKNLILSLKISVALVDAFRLDVFKFIYNRYLPLLIPNLGELHVYFNDGIGCLDGVFPNKIKISPNSSQGATINSSILIFIPASVKYTVDDRALVSRDIPEN